MSIYCHIFSVFLHGTLQYNDMSELSAEAAHHHEVLTGFFLSSLVIPPHAHIIDTLQARDTKCTPLGTLTHNNPRTRAHLCGYGFMLGTCCLSHSLFYWHNHWPCHSGETNDELGWAGVVRPEIKLLSPPLWRQRTRTKLDVISCRTVHPAPHIFYNKAQTGAMVEWSGTVLIFYLSL